jgi:hypothetical protein
MSLQPQSLNYVHRILDMERYNGRVNIVEPENPEIQFQMFEKVAARNKATEYRGAIDNILESTSLSQAFFSAANIRILQNATKAAVYEMSNGKYILPDQNIDSLKIIMRSTYLQFAEHHPTGITKQIEVLNKRVVDYTSHYCYEEAVSYVKYLKDQSSLVMPLERELPHDRDYKQLELKPWL